MNINNASTIRYITRASEEIDERNPDVIPYLGNYCSECDSHIDSFNSEMHLLYKERLLIGCEGYWFINPSHLGIHSPNWSDYRIQD
jgi:hypothetical protein